MLPNKNVVQKCLCSSAESESNNLRIAWPRARNPRARMTNDLMMAKKDEESLFRSDAEERNVAAFYTPLLVCFFH